MSLLTIRLLLTSQLTTSPNHSPLCLGLMRCRSLRLEDTREARGRGWAATDSSEGDSFRGDLLPFFNMGVPKYGWAQTNF